MNDGNIKGVAKNKKKMKTYNFTLGRITHFKLLNPRNAIKKTKHKETTYYYFEAEVISKDQELIPFGKHTIQLPAKRIVFPLIKEIEELGKLDETVEITVKRKSNSIFNICIHK